LNLKNIDILSALPGKRLSHPEESYPVAVFLGKECFRRVYLKNGFDNFLRSRQTQDPGSTGQTAAVFSIPGTGFLPSWFNKIHGKKFQTL